MLRDVPVHRSTWVADRRIRAATALPDPQVVVRELARHRKANVDVSPQVVARAWLKAGRVQEAQRALAGQAHGTRDPMLMGATARKQLDFFAEHLK